MLTEIQEKWLTALESGNYKQGIDYLRSLDDTYCCLGVACEVMGIEPVKGIRAHEYNGWSWLLMTVNLCKRSGYILVMEALFVDLNTKAIHH